MTISDVLRLQAGMVRQIVGMNVAGVTQAESLIQPQPSGTCLNWVVGHLVAIYQNVLPLVGQEPVLPLKVTERYARGSEPIRDPSEALDITDLMAAWDECCARFDAGLAGISAEALASAAPMSPTDNPAETVGSLLATISWHQAYHAGQTGILRRMTGKPGTM